MGCETGAFQQPVKGLGMTADDGIVKLTHSLHRWMTPHDIAPRLWNIVSEGVLTDLHKKDFEFLRCRDGFAHFSVTLKERLVSAERLYGVHRFAVGPRFRWVTVVDMNSECIRGFATPEIEPPDILQSFLDVGSSHRPKEKRDAKNSLFRYTGRPEEKCVSKSERPKGRIFPELCPEEQETAGNS